VCAFGEEAAEMSLEIGRHVRPRDAHGIEAKRMGLLAQPVLEVGRAQKSRLA
jgi:hypothetical protein